MACSNDGIGSTNPTQILIMDFNAMFAWAFAFSNLQNMRHMGKYSNYKKFENTFSQLYSSVPQFGFYERQCGKCPFIFH